MQTNEENRISHILLADGRWYEVQVGDGGDATFERRGGDEFKATFKDAQDAGAGPLTDAGIVIGNLSAILAYRLRD